MVVTFDCQECGNRIEVSDGNMGGEFDCPSCGKKVTIPQITETNEAQPPRMSPPIQSSYNTAPPEPNRKGRVFANLCKGGLALILTVLFLGLLLSVLSHARELSRRSVCSGNLKGIATGFYTYGSENIQDWPAPPHMLSDADTIGTVDYTEAIGSYRGKAGDRSAGDVSIMKPLPNKLSNTRGMWSLIRKMVSTPKSFVCPSSQDMSNTESNLVDYWDFGQGDITGPATPEQSHLGWKQVSYGYQVPFGRFGKPCSDRDQRMPLMADKGPFGAAIEAGKPMPGSITVTHSSDTDAWQAWNSPNHENEGQNVLFADGHAEWHNTPAVGIGYDNIYTQWSGQGLTDAERTGGNPPTLGGRQTPAGNTDTLLYP